MDLLELYDTYKNAVYRLALSYLHSASDAEDITQDVFLKLLEKSVRLEPEKAKAWLLAVTANLCRDRLRRQKRHPEEELSEELSLEDHEYSEVLDAVMQLPPKERAVVYLFYYEGYSVKETAQILKITRTAVTTRLGRARKHLKKSLEEF